MGHAWILNLDADDELARPSSYRGPAPAMRARILELAPRLGGLLAADDVVISDHAARGLEGRAWCPTPWALAQLEKAGARAPDAPPLAVLQRVNHRRFSAELGQTLDGAAWAESMADVERAVAAGASLGKRPFGYAGRGRRKLAARLDSGDRAFVEATLREWGGVQLEPIVAISAEFAVHGELSRDGAVRFGVPTRQSCDAHGAWLASEPAGDALAGAEAAALADEARRVARALADAGYFGPFGVDAYRYAAESGAPRFNPRGEINARFTMGWGVGMRLG